MFKKKKPAKVIDPEEMEVPEVPKAPVAATPTLNKKMCQIVETILLEGGLLKTIIISGFPLGVVGERFELE